MTYIQDFAGMDVYGPFTNEYDAHEYASVRHISTYQMLTQDDVDREYLVERGYVTRPR